LKIGAGGSMLESAPAGESEGWCGSSLPLSSESESVGFATMRGPILRCRRAAIGERKAEMRTGVRGARLPVCGGEEERGEMWCELDGRDDRELDGRRMDKQGTGATGDSGKTNLQ
jgi:hypothetical protein